MEEKAWARVILKAIKGVVGNWPANAGRPGVIGKMEHRRYKKL